ncbi:MAG: hypothetical protein PVF66_10725 [Candidatus Aminicenantes bacterium]|jgi:uncharacterized membrane protein
MEMFKEQQKKGKGRLIKTFLVLMIFSSFFIALNEIVYLISNKVLFKSLSPTQIIEGIANISSALIVVDFILNLAVIVFAIAIWKRKIWGLYAYGGYIIVMNFILPLIAGVPASSLIPGLIALVIWGTIAYSLWSEYA